MMRVFRGAVCTGPLWNDINVVVEQPFGKPFGEQPFDLRTARPLRQGGSTAATPPWHRRNGQSVASPSPANSCAVGRRIQRSTACHSVNEIG